MAALHPESEKSDFWTQIENSNWLEQVRVLGSLWDLGFLDLGVLDIFGRVDTF